MRGGVEGVGKVGKVPLPRLQIAAEKPNVYAGRLQARKRLQFLF